MSVTAVKHFPKDDLITYKSNYDIFSNPGSSNYINLENVGLKNLQVWGQLKSLVNELQFLNTSWSDATISKPVMLYIGAAPGTHLVPLIELYPWFEWYLYDEKNIDPRILELNISSQGGKIVFQKRLFSESDVEYWRNYQDENKNVFIICDVRNPDYRSDLQASIKEEMIDRDLKFQKELINKINPVKALCRVRLPSVSDSSKHYEFLDGAAYRYAFDDLDSNSFGLVVTDNETTRYWNVKQMKEATEYHNTVIRKQYFIFSEGGKPTFISEKLGITKTYDGILLYIVFMEYMSKFSPLAGKRKPSYEEVTSLIEKVLTSIKSNGENLLLPKSKR